MSKYYGNSPEIKIVDISKKPAATPTPEPVEVSAPWPKFDVDPSLSWEYAEHIGWSISNGYITVSASSGKYEDKRYLVYLILPDVIDGYKVEGVGSFESCDSIAEIKLPKYTKVIDSFEACTSLKHATIPEGVIDAHGSFYRCSKLEAIYVSPNATNYPWYKDFIDYGWPVIIE